jgi:hypothetical protein
MALRRYRLADSGWHLELRLHAGCEASRGRYFEAAAGSPETLAGAVHIGDMAKIHVGALAADFPARSRAPPMPSILLPGLCRSKSMCLIARVSSPPGCRRMSLLKFQRSGDSLGVPVQAVDGASVPQPFGGKYRQIQIYVNPVKLQAHQLSPMDVVRSVNQANAILPSGDVRIELKDFNIYTNSQFPDTEQIDRLPLKTLGNGHCWSRMSDTPRTPRPFRPTLFAWTVSIPSTFRS